MAPSTSADRPRLFDSYIVIDWSAQATPCQGADSVWIGHPEWIDGRLVDRNPMNPSSRNAAIEEIAGRLQECVRDGRRVLVGFDLPYGYPDGFASIVYPAGAGSDPPWRRTWKRLATLVMDDAKNHNNRFTAAAELNRQTGTLPGPFWGRPKKCDAGPALPSTMPPFPFRVGASISLQRYRRTEQRLRDQRKNVQETWKLYGAGSVGSQALLGIPAVYALRQREGLAEASAVWPFETGFTSQPTLERSINHAEIWPGVIKCSVGEGKVKDEAQVSALAQCFGRMDGDGRLPSWFNRPPNIADNDVAACVSEEGWILGTDPGVARDALRAVEKDLWGELLAKARWRSPLLVMDEAHHLKNPGTRLARMLQSPESEADLRTGDGAMAGAFDRMLFLTATPFQLGHHELVRVLERFGDVRWDDRELGDRELFGQQMVHLRDRLDDSQRCGIALQRAWSRLRLEDLDGDVPVDAWWERLQQSARDSLTAHQRAVVDAYEAAKRCRVAAQDALRPWIVRHNNGAFWPGTRIGRRRRVDGAAVAELTGSTGLPIPPDQLLPFFLAARSAVKPGQDLLGEALCSSFEAFRFTRENRKAARDEDDEGSQPAPDLSHASWYLAEFDHALKRSSGGTHPKMHATVRKVVDLWAKGEKVLVFAFYRHTCRALRIHIKPGGRSARDGGGTAEAPRREPEAR